MTVKYKDLSPDEKLAIKKLHKSYGVYGALRLLLQSCRESCLEDYSGNPEAVIHRDVATLEAAEIEMRANHFLRSRDL